MSDSGALRVLEEDLQTLCNGIAESTVAFQNLRSKRRKGTLLGDVFVSAASIFAVEDLFCRLITLDSNQRKQIESSQLFLMYSAMYALFALWGKGEWEASPSSVDDRLLDLKQRLHQSGRLGRAPPFGESARGTLSSSTERIRQVRPYSQRSGNAPQSKEGEGQGVRKLRRGRREITGSQ
jgi:hypothetical protein